MIELLESRSANDGEHPDYRLELPSESPETVVRPPRSGVIREELSGKDASGATGAGNMGFRGVESHGVNPATASQPGRVLLNPRRSS